MTLASSEKLHIESLEAEEGLSGRTWKFDAFLHNSSLDLVVGVRWYADNRGCRVNGPSEFGDILREIIA
jgi:hypothetical protein